MYNFEDFKIWFEQELKEAQLSLDPKCIELMYESFFSKLESEKNPKIITLGGGPGAGKTTFRKKHLKIGLANNYHIHDLDETLILLPGYQEMLKKEGPVLAFEAWWPTAQKLTNIMMVYATKNKLNIIYDRTCGTEASYLALKSAKERGYCITFYGFYADEAKALERVNERTKTEGRAVTQKIVSEYLRRFSTLWPYYLKIMDDVILFDNNGLEYKEIFSMHNGKSKVLHYSDYRKFLSTAFDIEVTKGMFPNIPAILDEIKLEKYQKAKAWQGLFYVTFRKIEPHMLRIYKLSENSTWLEQAALWAEEKWGYVRGFPGISKRKELIGLLKDGFYMVTYGKCAVGMFALLDHQKPNTKELMYVYIDEALRGLGIGNLIITKAKQISEELGAKEIIFDTLNPNLNRFYEKLQAKAVCDGQLLGHPTTVFRM